MATKCVRRGCHSIRLRETGAVQFVKGSHRWVRTFRRTCCVPRLRFPTPKVKTSPTTSASATQWDIAQWDTEPGDITVHHARTIHGADGNASLTQRRRAISVRYCGDDVVYKFKRGAPLKARHARSAKVRPSTTTSARWFYCSNNATSRSVAVSR